MIAILRRFILSLGKVAGPGNIEPAGLMSLGALIHGFSQLRKGAQPVTKWPERNASGDDGLSPHRSRPLPSAPNRFVLELWPMTAETRESGRLVPKDRR